MNTIYRTVLTLAAALAPFHIARAAFDARIVAADSRWVVYSDLNALKASTVGRELVALAESAQLENNNLPVALNVHKLLETIGSVTAYGANFSKDARAIDGTLVIQGTPDLRKIVEGFLVQATVTEPQRFSEVKDLPFTAYAVTPGGSQPELIVAFPAEPVVLVSKSRPQLLRARDVVLGKAPSLAQSPSSLAPFLKRSSGAFFFAASVVPSEDVVAISPQARVLQMAESGALAIGESGERTFAHIELATASDDAADKMMKILDGVAAMMSLAETTDRQLAEFINSTHVGRDGRIVTLDLAYSSTRLVQMWQNVSQTERPRRTPDSPPTSGRVLAQWDADEAGGDDVSWQTIENVSLANGARVTLGWRASGRTGARFERVEIAPANGAGALLAFGPKLWNNGPNRAQFSFPGMTGIYTLKVGYVATAGAKARFAVSVDEPRPAAGVERPKQP
jgi:hypothetical protein